MFRSQMPGPAVGLALVVLTAAAHGAETLKGARFPRELDEYVVRVLREWDLPGAAVAVVKDGQVVVVKGYGVREVGKPDRVDAQTIFDVASLTKGFTAAAIATLVDERKMSWDAPVRDYLPRIEFPDPYLTANVTIRDLLCHRTGIRGTNSAWYLTGVPRPQLLGLVKNMQVAAPFRTRLVYSNIGFTIAGEAAAAAADTSWEHLVTQRLIVPLGLSRTTVQFDSVPAMGNFAAGHELIDGEQRVIPRETTRASTAPAGVLHTTAADLATWMLFQLGDGTFHGRRILSAEALNEMHSPQIVMVPSERFRQSRQLRHFPGYGLGWQAFDYRGHPMVWHSGNGDGHLAYLAMFPEVKLGIAVLVNSWKAGSLLNVGIASRIADHYLGGPRRDYSAELRDWWSTEEERADALERTLQQSRLRDTRPSLPLRDYEGVFKDRLGLDTRVWLEADTLRLQYGGGEVATLDHWHHDLFRTRWRNPMHAKLMSTFVSFGLDARGTVDRLRMEPMGDEVEARRLPP